MSETKIQVPEGMLKAAIASIWEARGCGYHELRGEPDIRTAVEAALLWQQEYLHERNVDFHRAILAAERERFPGSDQDTAIIMRRVDFEYGVSFARNYIRRMYDAPEQEMPVPISDLRVLNGSVYTHDQINERMTEAYRRGQQDRK